MQHQMIQRDLELQLENERYLEDSLRMVSLAVDETPCPVLNFIVAAHEAINEAGVQQPQDVAAGSESQTNEQSNNSTIDAVVQRLFENGVPVTLTNRQLRQRWRELFHSSIRETERFIDRIGRHRVEEIMARGPLPWRLVPNHL